MSMKHIREEFNKWRHACQPIEMPQETITPHKAPDPNEDFECFIESLSHTMAQGEAQAIYDLRKQLYGEES